MKVIRLNLKALNVLLLFCSLSFFNLSHADVTNQNDVRERCENIGNEISSTFNASDFFALKNISQWIIKNCRGNLARDSYYEYFATLALAERELVNLNASLHATADCIEKRYGIPACHLEEYFSLKTLRNLKKAEIAGDRFEKIVKQEMFNINEEMRTTTLDVSRQKYLESKLNLYKSMLGAYLRDSGKL